MIEKVVLSIVGDVEVRVAVVIIVSPSHAFRERDAVNARLCRHVLKCTVTLVTEELAGRVLVSDKEVDPAVIVVIGPGRRMSGIVHTQQAALEGHVSEGAVAVIAQKRVTHGPFPSAAHHVDVQPTIVVKVRLDDIDSPELCGEMRALRDVRQGTGAVVAEHSHRMTRIETGLDNVQKSAIGEVVDGSATCVPNLV